jgi:hypothetical protein
MQAAYFTAVEKSRILRTEKNEKNERGQTTSDGLHDDLEPNIVNSISSQFVG